MKFRNGFTEKRENFFVDGNGASINIKMTPYDKSDQFEFSKENAELLADYLLDDTISELKSRYGNNISNGKIISSNVENITQNNYKGFHILLSYEFQTITIYWDAYVIQTASTTFVFGVTANSLELINSKDIRNAIESFTIKNYSENDKKEVNSGYIILDLFLTVVAYCGLPIVLRIFKGKIEYNKGKKIIIINNIVVCVIFIVFKSSLGIASQGIAFITYYYINKLILLKKRDESVSTEDNEITMSEQDLSKDEIKNEDIINNTLASSDNNEVISTKSTSNNKDVKYCTNCGKVVEKSWKYCNYCGTKIQ